MNINKNAIIATILIAGPAFLIWPTSTGGAFAWTINGFLALIPSIKAAQKGRSFVPWLIYGMTLWLIALIHSCIINDNDKAKQEKGWHECPYCGEYSRPEATVCHCCGHNLF